MIRYLKRLILRMSWKLSYFHIHLKKLLAENTAISCELDGKTKRANKYWAKAEVAGRLLQAMNKAESP